MKEINNFVDMQFEVTFNDKTTIIEILVDVIKYISQKTSRVVDQLMLFLELEKLMYGLTEKVLFGHICTVKMVRKN